MKITKTASGKQTVKISKQDWINIGKKAGWTKKAQHDTNFSDEALDALTRDMELDSALEQTTGWDRFKVEIGISTWDEVVEAGVGDPTPEESKTIMDLGFYGQAITEESIEQLKIGQTADNTRLSLTYSGVDGSDEIQFNSKEEMAKYITDRLGADARNVTQDSFGTDYANYYLNNATMKALGIDVNRFQI